MRTVMLALCLAMAVAIATGRAQERPKPASPADDGTFDVATVRRSKSGEPFGSIRPGSGGRVTITNMKARDLVTFAYDIPGYLLVGGPGWLADEKFDITAKMEGNPAWGAGSGRPNPVALAMRKLLGARFKLKLHTESRELDAYALVLVKPGVTGPDSNHRLRTARR